MVVHLLEYIVQRNYVDLQTWVNKSKLWKYTFLLLYLDGKYAIYNFYFSIPRYVFQMNK